MDQNSSIPLCDPVNGTCNEGCLSGYIAPLCDTHKFTMTTLVADKCIIDGSSNFVSTFYV